MQWQACWFVRYLATTCYVDYHPRCVSLRTALLCMRAFAPRAASQQPRAQQRRRPRIHSIRAPARLPAVASTMEAVKEAKAAVKEALNDLNSFAKETGLLEKTCKLRCGTRCLQQTVRHCARRGARCHAYGAPRALTHAPHVAAPRARRALSRLLLMRASPCAETSSNRFASAEPQPRSARSLPKNLPPCAPSSATRRVRTSRCARP